MVNTNQTLTLPEGQFNVEVLQFRNTDRQNLFSIYNKWRSLSNDLISIMDEVSIYPRHYQKVHFVLR